MSSQNEMLEYLFFSRKMADCFIRHLQNKHLIFQEVIEPIQEAIVIKTSEDIADDLWDELDALYDELSAEDQQLLEQGVEDKAAMSSAGIYLQLANGQQTIAQVNPGVMNRILNVLSMDEFNAFVDTIVQAVEKPDDSAICQLRNEPEGLC